MAFSGYCVALILKAITNESIIEGQLAVATVNFLAHLYLADTHDHCLAGALLGDFVKGKLIDQYSQHWLNSINFHRQIDRYTDNHAAIGKARQEFQPPYRRYAGIIIDLMFDHFLVRDWHRYSQQPLAEFEQRCYRQLANDAPHFPQPAQRLTQYLVDHKLLSGYGDLVTVNRALTGVGSRLTRANPLATAESAITTAYEQLDQQFQLFFPELLQACKLQQL